MSSQKQRTQRHMHKHVVSNILFSRCQTESPVKLLLAYVFVCVLYFYIPVYNTRDTQRPCGFQMLNGRLAVVSRGRFDV